MRTSSRTATTPKRGLVQEVRREWLVHEDGAFALQLQDQEIAAHYGLNRERNRIVRQDTPQARKEQEDELKEALLLQNIQQQLRDQQEKEDEEAARQLAEELEKEEALKRQVTAIRDEQLARRMQNSASKPVKKVPSKEDEKSIPTEPVLCTSMKSMDLNQPMSEDEAILWQELCDAEMARKLQQDEEEESKFRRDVSDLGRKLAIEAQDRELAVMLQEKEKTRLRKAKEKARLIKAQQKAAAAAAATAAASAEASGQEWLEEANMDGATPVPPNVAACLDPTWRRRQEHIESQQHSQLSLPITDLDFPATMQPIVPGQRRVIDLHSQPASPEPDAIQQSPRSKSSKGCSQQ